MSVIGEVTISSPGSGSTAATAAWIAAVPEAQAKAWETPSQDANALSKAPTNEPRVLVNVPLAIALASRASSSAPRDRPEASWSLGIVPTGGSGLERAL